MRARMHLLLSLLTAIVALAGAHPLAAQDATETYESPTYGYRVSWDPEVWRIDESATQVATGLAAFDRLRLLRGNGPAYYIEGGQFGNMDGADCVAAESARFSSSSERSDYRPFVQDDGTELRGLEGELAFAAFQYVETPASGEPTEQVVFIACRLLPGTDVSVLFTLLTTVDLVEQSLDEAWAVIDTLELPPPAVATPLAATPTAAAAETEVPAAGLPEADLTLAWFEATVATATARDSVLSTPGSGELVQTMERVALHPIETELENFYLRVDVTNPSATDDAGWDFGVGFRGQDSGDHYRLVIASDASWLLMIWRAEDGSEPIASGTITDLNTAAGEGNTLELIASGETGAFRLNSEAIAPLDLSALSGASPLFIGAAFFTDNTVEGAITEFSGLQVWPLPPTSAGEATATPAPTSMPSPTMTPLPTATTPPTAISTLPSASLPTPTPTATPNPATEYTSPTYGFTVSWEVPTWRMDGDAALTAASTASLDRLLLRNIDGALLYVEGAGYGDADAAACVAAESDRLANFSRRGDYQPFTRSGVAMAGEEGESAFAAFTYTYTPEMGSAYDEVAYIECRLMPGTGDSLLFTLISEPSQFEQDLADTRAVIAAVQLPEAGPDQTPAPTATPMATATPVPTSTPTEGSTPSPTTAPAPDSSPSPEPTTARGADLPLIPTTAAGPDYTSPLFGYSLSWDASWTELGRASVPGSDILVLSNGPSDVSITGSNATDANVVACHVNAVRQLSAQPRLAGLTPVLINEQPLTGSDESRAWGVYRYTSSTGAARVVYLECRAVPAAEATIRIELYTSEEAYNSQVVQLSALLEHLTLPD